MPDELQRVGLVFKADGSVDFNKSLKEVNASIQENRSAFKLAKSTWDDSTKSVDKLRDTQKYLSQQTKDYSDKVKMLEGELKELTDGVGKNTEKIAKKREQLEATQKATENYRQKCEKLKQEVAELEKDETKNSDAIQKKKEQLAAAEKGLADYSSKSEKCAEQLEKLEAGEARNETAIQKKKDQLNNAEASLNNYKKGLEEVNDKLKSGSAQIEEYAKKLTDLGDKDTKAGKNLSKKVTAPILATGTAAMVAWNEIDGAYDNIATGTGALGDNLAKLNESFDTVYGRFPADAEEVSSAIADVNTRFGFTGEALEDCSEKFLKFSKINNMDVSTAVQDVSRYMGDASIDASEYGNVMDQLTAASQASGIAMDRLTENLAKYGAPMRALGFTTQESIAIFSQWEKAGVNTETAFSGMKKSISNWAAAGKDAGEEFKKTLDEIAACPDIASATTKAIEIFGTKAGPDLADAIQGGRFSIEEFMQVIDNSGGQLEGTWGEMYDGADAAKVAMQNLKLAGKDLAETAMPAIADIMQIVTEKIREFTNWFNSLDDSQKKTIITVAGVVAAIGPLLVIIGTVISSIGKVVGATKTVGTGVKLLWGIMKLNPVGAVITAVGALIGIFVTLYTKCEWFRDGVNNIFDSVKNGVKKAIDKIKSIFDFKWKLPEIKMPSFSIKGKFSLVPPSVPKLSVKWNAEGAILNRPTIFGMDRNGNMQGGGEAGKEAVLPIEKLKQYIREENQLNNKELISLMKDVFEGITLLAENNIYIGDKKVMDILTDLIMKRIDQKQTGKMMTKGVMV
ncbi:phage tail tape measure protein [Blautia producta]|uniref:phage tail tape measure protein n=1 Tax=Blautia producta TaxID=33035 RepID=UPI00205141F7|nr:MAG TPA: minor tail protein [Caudoviricetes sp.]